jgi:RimJ/RimL family protein N-acetyltransferase
VTHTVRRLGRDDVEAYRALRLEALVDAPTAYGSDYERESAFPPSNWIERLESSQTFGVFDGDAAVGIATFVREPGRKREHVGNIYGVYVAPAARRTGASRALIEGLIDAVRGTVMQLNLTVNAENVPALKLYEKLGFTLYGTEPRALFYEGRYYDEHLMVLRLE